MVDYIKFFISLIALIKGADLLIKEAEKIALKFGISEFIIGATLIAIGTSLPELATAIAATLENKSDIVVSNVIGSVIFNITLVLGLIFLIAKKIKPKRDIFTKDAAWSLFPLFAFILVSFDGVITRGEGFLFFILIFGYMLFLFRNPELVEEEIEIEKEKFNTIKTIIFLIIGFILVIYGADYLVLSATNIAQSLGISEWLIGLLLISFGTSLPELIVSIIAAKKGKADMSIGNIIGSNIANFSVVIGGASIIKPLTFNIKAYSFDILTAIIVSLMLLFITANKLYNRSAAIALLSILGIFLLNQIRI
ncbi:calcium/sodium antiporter [Caminibacter mediatlanticus TB-2]|uniref:Calcium/sodium antiporter n=1 Tax=Caminibacter mediatlanticus TB-2 TaxID=391592 RepID=A0ABX5VA79_9BACT|nr:calcium/sodium antiporter [Caminibacter mediatlanticus]QCT94287.1 calcium/sodium antiporter [Caminibacter mediatlanticus TB-2]